MKKFSIIFGLLAVAATLVSPEAVAQVTAATTAGGDDVGADLLETIMQQMSGNLGTAFGLGIAVFGLYMWIVQQATWGIVMIIGGVAFTAFPGLFGGIRESFEAATADVGASTALDSTAGSAGATVNTRGTVGG